MGIQIPTRLTGEGWQNSANKLLATYYGPTEYQRVQDNDKGDAGIEGFTITSGHAYQAHGCEEPLSNTLTPDIIKEYCNTQTSPVKIAIDTCYVFVYFS